ncbi:MAG: hypothetical protein V8T10_09095 [Merdibacter sp.]
MQLGYVLCNDSQTANGQRIGDPTELAFVDLAHHYGKDELELRRSIRALPKIRLIHNVR